MNSSHCKGKGFGLEPRAAVSRVRKKKAGSAVLPFSIINLLNHPRPLMLLMSKKCCQFLDSVRFSDFLKMTQDLPLFLAMESRNNDVP